MSNFLLSCMLLGGGALASVLTYANDQNDHIIVKNYTFPTILSHALQQGINIPVYLKYNEDPTLLNDKSEQKFADATIIYKNDNLYVKHLNFNSYQQTTTLSAELKQNLESLDRSLNDNLQINVNDDSSLKLDLESLYLELSINKAALDTKIIPRSNVLEESTSKEASSILNYRFGYSYNEYEDGSNSSNFLNLDSISSFKEHHLNINGSIYDINERASKTSLYRAMYEHDIDGHRFAVGLMDTWSMQSIANFSALNSSKIYGVTYGNKSNTVISDNKLSLNPIIVFLPSAGTVQIYRDGRLLSIQNFSVGSHELDTSSFPYGIYSVEIKTIIDGKETITTSQVNKTFGRSSSVTGKLDWQVFSGMLKYSKPETIDYIKNINEKNTWLIGTSLAKNYNILSGVGLSSAVYAFDENFVVEGQSTFSLTDNMNLTLQTMLASDSSYLAATSFSYNLPNGYGSVYGGLNRSEEGSKLYFTENYSFDGGFGINLKKLNSKLGYLNASYNKDLKRKYSNTNIEYSQSLLNTRYANINLRAGLQKSIYENQRSDNDKYIFLDFSMPISKWFSAGVSSRNSNLLANASYKQNFNDSIVQSVGVDLKQVIDRKNDLLNQDNFSASAYLSYQNLVNSGTLSGNASAHSRNFNYTTQGSIASSNFDVGFGNNSHNAGVLIKTGLPSDTTMSALINGQDYMLKGNRNFIPLAPYKKYNVELRSDKTSMDTVSIGQGRQSTIVLYPGNVAKLEPEVKQMVTIFGRIRYPDGEVAANTQLNNHIGKTKTDTNGEFSLDVDKKYPTITLIKDNGDICESVLALKDKQGVAWLGEISCVYKAASRSKNNLEVRNHE